MRSGRRGWSRVYDIWFGILLAFGCLDVDLWDGSDLEDRLDLGASAARTFRDIEFLNSSRKEI
jgi:hypothetical protein